MRIVPGWGGSMFEELMPNVFVPEEDWGPQSWGENHPLHVRAQIEHGLEDADYGYGGFSPASDPFANYREYGVDLLGMNPDGYHSDRDGTNPDLGFGECRPATNPDPEFGDGVVTPHAAFLAMMHATQASFDNLARIGTELGAYGPGGFYDAVAVGSGTIAERYLSLDQAMIMGALGNVMAGDLLQRAFRPPRWSRRSGQSSPWRSSAPAPTSRRRIDHRDLNRNGHLDPFEDPRLTPEERADDLLGRLSLPEKIGLLFHTVIEQGPGGTLLDGPGAISKTGTREVVLGKHLTHFNVHALGTPREAARWHNGLQGLAEEAPHGIPVTVSTDPRHGSSENAGASFAAGSFSQWPEPIGIGALHDPEAARRYAEVVRAEYVAVGIRMALGPTLDLATEPCWARQQHTFGQDPQAVSRLGEAFLQGIHGDGVGPGSVACVVKHFPGGGPQKDGEDAHFPYGREQVYPAGRFEDHLAPFRPAVAMGVAGVMPYYGMPVGLERDGVAVPEVGFGYNRYVLGDLLRDELGYDGLVLSDWELINDNLVGDQVLPARAWGVEHLDARGRMELLLEAGCDQFGGEECVEILADLVAAGRVTEARVDVSARRALLVKFRLGLFDDPYVDEDDAERVVGSEEFRRAGLEAQAASVTVLLDGAGLLPLGPGRRRIYAEGLASEQVARLGEQVTRAEDADLAVVRLQAPFEPRSDLFLEAWFHQGSLDFPPGLPMRLGRIAEHCPLVVDVNLDRPAVLTPLLPVASVLTATFGTSDEAFADSLTGVVAPRGRLPFDLPRSMDDVRAHPEDRPGFEDPLFRRATAERQAGAVVRFKS